MSWVSCHRCRFSQIPAERCRRCGEPLEVPDSSASAKPAGTAPSGAEPRSESARILAGAAGGTLVLLVLAIALASGRHERSSARSSRAASPLPSGLDLSGRWTAQLSKLIGDPPRPVLKEISIDSDTDGLIRAARVVLTDPGRGGAGAGYRMAPDGPSRLSRAASRLAVRPAATEIPIDFLEPPGWLPTRPRLWRAIEGAGPDPSQTRYALVESLETDYLVQAGINESGFLSYAFFSKAYAPPRGQDQLSRIIHPEPDASLRGFRNVLWDLSGAADFLRLRVSATVSGPDDGPPDRVILKR